MAKNATKDEGKVTEAQAEETKQTESKSEGDKPKRKQLSPAERIAKLEAELDAARNRASARAQRKVERLETQRAALIEKRDELDAKIKAVESDIDEAKQLVDQASDAESAEAEDESAA